MAIFSSLSPTRRRMRAAAAAGGDRREQWFSRLAVADVGAATARAIVDDAARRAEHKGGAPDADDIVAVITPRLRRLEAMIATDAAAPFVILVMGVNGCGKTTTIAKLCRHFQNQGKSVLLAAGDTFRAAAREQLEKWARRLGGIRVIGASRDAAAVAFDAVAQGVAQGVDVVIVDTSGRLPTQKHLIAELAKTRRAIGKACPTAPHEMLLILDATTGQNAQAQAQAFADAAGITGIIVTKLDGSSKGGFLLALAEKKPAPVRFVGVGERVDDLLVFDADEYAAALIGAEAGVEAEAV